MLKTVGNLSERSGNQTIINGNLVIGTAGNGIDFSATPGTGTSELFNDYEEGTWTPVFTCDTVGNLSFTYTSQLGFYTKVGRVVTANFFLTLAPFTHTTASGVVRVTGLPFTALTTTGSAFYGAMSFQGIQRANYTQAACFPLNNTTQIIFPLSAPATSQNLENLIISNMPTGGFVILRGSVSYIV